MEGVLLSFLVLVVTLFFIPKALERFHIPAPLTEFALGILFAVYVPWVVHTDMIAIFAMIGVITIFIFAGAEVDIEVVKGKRIWLNLLSHLALLALITAGLWAGQLADVALLSGISPVVLVLVATTLITPSAGFILSMLNGTEIGAATKKLIQTKAITAEMLAIALLVVMLNVTDPLMLILVMCALAVLVLVLPWILRFLHGGISSMSNAKFSFFFVIALLCAFVTESLGMHFLVGAFIAGMLISRFIDELVGERQVSAQKGEQLVQGMNFLATLFVPFYFFSVGFHLQTSSITPHILLVAFILFLAVSSLRVVSVSGFQMLHKGSFKDNVRNAAALLPTLMVGFIFADLLYAQGLISQRVFAVLVWYGVFTSIAAVAVRPLLTDN